MSFTYKPKKVKRAKKHGFLSRSRTSYGKRVLKKRMQKGRKRLSTV
ncbi:MAG: 50S ribosomal protein L34 [bacterium]